MVWAGTRCTEALRKRTRDARSGTQSVRRRKADKTPLEENISSPTTYLSCWRSLCGEKSAHLSLLWQVFVPFWSAPFQKLELGGPGLEVVYLLAESNPVTSGRVYKTQEVDDAIGS